MRATPASRSGPQFLNSPNAVHIALAAATVALAVVAFAFHPIGDYFTESDFYGGYAAGAREVQRGHIDWSRYGVYGPVYEMALAAVAALTRDLFVAARLISVASAVAILAAVAWLARRRWGSVSAFWLVLLVATNATFFRYGYSATTDMLGGALWTVAAVALLASRQSRVLMAAGAAAALATLTRYNLLTIVPAGLVLVLVTRDPLRERFRAAVVFGGAFLAVVAPFVIASQVTGHPLGETLLKDAGFYLNEAPDRALESRYRLLDQMVQPDTTATLAPVHAVSRFLIGVPRHLAADARTLLGWPVAALIVLSIASLGATRRARALLALAPLWAFTFLALAPIYYSDRYSLVLVPVYLAPAALGLATGLEAGRGRGAAAWLVGLLVVTLSVSGSIALQRAVAASIPREALAAGEALRRVARPGERVLARKAQVAYAAGLESVPFPDVDSLESLASFARRSGARYLYYSWYELRLRPRFGYLLDTSASVPGLTPLHATIDKPSASYRIAEGFGMTPPWWNDASVRRRIEARVNALMAPARGRSPGSSD
jgi:hypothetical protein